MAKVKAVVALEVEAPSSNRLLLTLYNFQMESGAQKGFLDVTMDEFPPGTEHLREEIGKFLSGQGAGLTTENIIISQPAVLPFMNIICQLLQWLSANVATFQI